MSTQRGTGGGFGGGSGAGGGGGSSGSASRFTATGTTLVAGDFALSAGWGNTAAVSAVSGNDQSFTLTVTANGTGIVANPTVTLTFKDGAWAAAPGGLAKMTGGTGAVADVTGVPGTTTWIMTFNDLPIAADTYIISGMVMGR